jgi:hypothetical protein
LKIKYLQWPETVIALICWNFIWKIREITVRKKSFIDDTWKPPEVKNFTSANYLFLVPWKKLVCGTNQNLKPGTKCSLLITCSRHQTLQKIQFPILQIFVFVGRKYFLDQWECFLFPPQKIKTKKWQVIVTNHVSYFCDRLTEIA